MRYGSVTACTQNRLPHQPFWISFFPRMFNCFYSNSFFNIKKSACQQTTSVSPCRWARGTGWTRWTTTGGWAACALWQRPPCSRSSIPSPPYPSRRPTASSCASPPNGPSQRVSGQRQMHPPRKAVDWLCPSLIFFATFSLSSYSPLFPGGGVIFCRLLVGEDQIPPLQA